jgi:hypothetical protein
VPLRVVIGVSKRGELAHHVSARETPFERYFVLTSIRVTVRVESPEIVAATLHKALPTYFHLYTVPFLSLYPVLAYAYYVKYDVWLQSEEWTFLACTTLGLGHALSFLATRWSTGARAWITTRTVSVILRVGTLSAPLRLSAHSRKRYKMQTVSE